MTVTDGEFGSLQHRVKELEQKIDFLLQVLNLQYTPPPVQTEYPEVLALVQQGNMIEAIKAYRLKTGVGLADAKAFVEQLAAQYRSG